MEGLIQISNPIDGKPMFWFNNDFTVNNWPGPEHQAQQKRESLKYILEKGKGVLDIGAHIGDFGLCMAKALKNLNRTDIMVYCIEPTKSKCEFMEEVKKANELENVTIICKGLADKVGRFSVKRHGFAGLDNLGRNTGGWQWTKDENGVEFTTLDYLYNNKMIGAIGFFWLDAQWSEEIILKGGKNYLSKFKPYILMEYWPCIEYHQDNESVMHTVEGSREDLLNDKSFKKIFSENKITVSNKGREFDDILLEFYDDKLIIGPSESNIKTIILNKCPEIESIFYNSNMTFNYEINKRYMTITVNNKKKKIPLSDNLFKLTRTDKNEGWNDNLMIFIRKKNN